MGAMYRAGCVATRTQYAWLDGAVGTNDHAEGTVRRTVVLGKVVPVGP